MLGWVAYLGLLALLVVRVRTTDDAPRPGPIWVQTGEPLGLTRLHHALFYVLLVGSPVVGLVVGSDSDDRVLGGVLFGAGVLLYRRAGRALGSSLSPLILPRPGGVLVTGDVYRFVRHPMYLGEGLIAVGAPLLAGAPVLLWVAGVALGVLVARIALEESALARTYPEFPRYAAATRRILPFVI
jgi:protein-S-isoprenylcysteine O-methyltransferase Ste14